MTTQTTFTVDDIEMLDGVIDAYCQRHSTGGSLHIVLDDDNWKRSDIEFCRTRASNHNDHVGVVICELLLLAPDDVLKECGDLGRTLGFQFWKDKVLA